jgi:hypothetical protein
VLQDKARSYSFRHHSSVSPPATHSSDLKILPR